MKRSKVLAVVASVVAATMLPLSASAATPPKAEDLYVIAVKLEPEAPGLSYHQPGSCSRGWVRIQAHTIAARTTKSASAPVAFYIISPDYLQPMYYPCRSLEVGGAYPSVCGAANTGWILVAAPEYERQGWIVNQCTADPNF